MSEPMLCQWCKSDQLHIHKNHVKVANAQMEQQPHTLYLCQDCQQYTLATYWGNQSLSYRAVVQRRFMRSPIYLVIYAISCAWCHHNDQIEPAEINATIANPLSRRHRYDIYACYACHQYTAVAYVGEVHTYQAKRDKTYGTLYHLIGDE